MAKVKFEEEIDFEVVEEKYEELEDDLIIKDKGLVILDLESLIIEAGQNVGPYTMLGYLEPYIEEIYNYTLALKEEYENVE